MHKIYKIYEEVHKPSSVLSAKPKHVQSSANLNIVVYLGRAERQWNFRGLKGIQNSVL